MKSLVQSYNKGQPAVTEVPAPALQPGGVLVRNHISLISAGTERLMVDMARKTLVGGHGADKIIVAASTKSSQPVELAAELARSNAKVVAVGAANTPAEPPGRCRSSHPRSGGLPRKQTGRLPH